MLINLAFKNCKIHYLETVFELKTLFEKYFDTEPAYNDKYLMTNTTSYQNK